MKLTVIELKWNNTELNGAEYWHDFLLLYSWNWIHFLTDEFYKINAVIFHVY